MVPPLQSETLGFNWVNRRKVMTESSFSLLSSGSQLWPVPSYNSGIKSGWPNDPQFLHMFHFVFVAARSERDIILLSM